MDSGPAGTYCYLHPAAPEATTCVHGPTLLQIQSVLSASYLWVPVAAVAAEVIALSADPDFIGKTPLAIHHTKAITWANELYTIILSNYRNRYVILINIYYRIIHEETTSLSCQCVGMNTERHVLLPE